MPVTLTIPILQEHNVCSDGQVKFRRKFTRSRTWQTYEGFVGDFAEHHNLWNWDEAAEKFLGGEEGVNDWERYRTKLEEEHNEDTENDQDTQWAYAQLGCVAWCKLYWDKVAGTVPEDSAPKVAKAYLSAVEHLEAAKKFKRNMPRAPQLSVDFRSYYAGGESAIEKYLGSHIADNLPRYVEDAIASLEAEVKAKRDELAGLLHPVTIDAPLGTGVLEDPVPIALRSGKTARTS